MGTQLMTVAVLVLSHNTFVSAQNPSKLEETKEDKVATELKKFAGRWQIEKATFAGRDFPFTPGAMQEFDGSVQKSFVLNMPGSQAIWLVELDPSTDPKRMTLIDGEMKNGQITPKADGYVARIVYSLNGDKLTTVQWRGPKPEFPKSLDWKAGDPVMVLELKRVKN